MARIYHTTVYDAVQYLLNSSNRSLTSDVNLGIARRAIVDAVDQIVSSHPWISQQELLRFSVNAPYTFAATATYTHSGGAAPRIVAIPGATLPSWAGRGILVMNGVAHRIESRRSNTELTLDFSYNPGASTTATSGNWMIYNSIHEVPDDFVQGGVIYIAGNGTTLESLSPADFLGRRFRGDFTRVQPEYWTYLGDRTQPGKVQLELHPLPMAAVTLDCMYTAYPRRPLYERYDIGTATVSAGSTTITGEGTGWTSDMVGSVIRLSYGGIATLQADADHGAQAFSRMVLPAPYIYERRITAVASATSLTVDEAVPVALTRVVYVVSDPIEFEPVIMRRMFWRCLEWQYALATNRPDVQDFQAKYQAAMSEAVAADAARLRTQRQFEGGSLHGVEGGMPATGSEV